MNRTSKLLLGTRKKGFIFVLTFPMAPWCNSNTGHFRTENWKTLGTSANIWIWLILAGQGDKITFLLTFPMAPWRKFNTGRLRTASWKTLGTSTQLWIWLLGAGQTENIFMFLLTSQWLHDKNNTGHARIDNWRNSRNANKHINLTSRCGADAQHIHIFVDFPNGSRMQIF